MSASDVPYALRKNRAVRETDRRRRSNQTQGSLPGGGMTLTEQQALYNQSYVDPRVGDTRRLVGVQGPTQGNLNPLVQSEQDGRVAERQAGTAQRADRNAQRQAIREQQARAAGQGGPNSGPTGGAWPGGAQQSPQDIMDMLFGPGGGNEDVLAAIEESYDGEIAALTGLSSELGGLTQNLIGNINSSAGAAQDQIGSFFGYAADQANAGRPVIAETGETAMGNIDAIYDNLAGSLAAIPQQSVNQASAAAGDAVGGSVAGRVAAATAPFAAAGETSRANTQANMVQHSAAGQDYLSQLAAAAPSEAALSQGAVAGRANNAVTEAEMALAQQRAEISAQTAALEGAKQRALVEQSADTAGTTFDRMMQTAQLMNATGSDMGPLRDQLGFDAAAGEAGDPLEGLRQQAEAVELMDIINPPQESPLEVGGDAGFNAAIESTSPATQEAANRLREYAESEALGMPEINELLSPQSHRERGPSDLPSAGPFGPVDDFVSRLYGDDSTEYVEWDSEMNDGLVELLDELGAPGAFDMDAVRQAFRAWYQQ